MLGTYTTCAKCGKPTEVYGSKWCSTCHYPGIDEDYARFQDLLDDGHRYIDAAVSSGWMGIEEFSEREN